MKHPKSADAYKIADTFELMAKARLGRVNMANSNVPARNHICGSSACHAGWFAVAKVPLGYFHTIDFTKGSLAMGRVLGKPRRGQLSVWADCNPEIWGNGNGEEMFYNDAAFTTGKPPTLGKIAKHWYGVASRLEALEKKQ